MDRPEIILAPGPTPIPPEVLLAQGSPLVYHRGPGFGDLMREVTGRLRELYRTDTADGPPMQVFDPPVHLARGSEVTYACTYRGEPDRDITFGPSLADDAMCSMVGGWLPAGGAEPGLLSCDDGGCLSCFEAVVRQAPDQVCDEERAALDAYQACACQGACGSACSASACAGQMPDDDCRACLDSSCAAETEACVGGG